jgi:hypothetical protein
MKMNNLIKLIFSLYICLFFYASVKSEKSSKNHLKKTATKNRNKNKRTERFYNGEEAEVDDNGDIVYDRDLFEDKTLVDDTAQDKGRSSTSYPK